jgi:RHS repeat-associated protein
MELVADIDRERSLAAMWCPYLAPNSVAENHAENRTSVVRAFLNARYFNSAQGQFLSEDPVFLGDPKQQNLKDPQSLNSYNYANDNPIVKSDPTGRCAGPLLIVCIGIIGGGISSYATYAGDVINNRTANNPNMNPFLDNLSSPGAYIAGDASGAVSLAYLQEYRLYAAGLSFGTSITQDDLNGKTRDYKKALVDAGITAATGVSFDAAIGKSAAKTTTAKLAGDIVSNLTPVASQSLFSYRPQMPAIVQVQSSYSTLPSTVTQGGIKYIRNSSSLLNIAK